MSEITQEEALRLADDLVGQALKETEARCAVLAQFIDGRDHAEPLWSSLTRKRPLVQIQYGPPGRRNKSNISNRAGGHSGGQVTTADPAC
jgi:hypothetical protein